MTDLTDANTAEDHHEEDISGRYDVFIDWAVRGSEALRKHVRVDEEMFVRTHGQAVADSRGYFLYAALNECQKAGMHLMRFQHLLSGEEVSPLTDRPSRLLVESIIEEARARERRLVELLVNLVLFSTTNEQIYYRHFFVLEELEDMFRANDDLEEFHGARSRNVDASIQRQADWLVTLQRDVDFTRTWYLEDGAGPVPSGEVVPKKLARRVRFSRMRHRIRRAMPLMTVSEKLCTGTSYADAYSAPSDAVHFGVNTKPYRLQVGHSGALVTKIGLIVAAILDRIHLLLGRPRTPIIDQLARVLARSDSKDGKTLIEHLTDRGLQVGDFVLVHGDLAEILEVRVSRYGTHSYKVLYLAERPLPDVVEDWFPARYVRPYYTRNQVAQTMKDLWARHSLPEEVLDQLQADTAGMQDALRRSITQLWPLIKEATRGDPGGVASQPQS